MKLTKYKINVRTFNGKVITFNVDSYEIIDSVYIEFKDLIGGEIKRYPIIRTEILVRDGIIPGDKK